MNPLCFIVQAPVLAAAATATITTTTTAPYDLWQQFTKFYQRNNCNYKLYSDSSCNSCYLSNFAKWTSLILKAAFVFCQPAASFLSYACLFAESLLVASTTTTTCDHKRQFSKLRAKKTCKNNKPGNPC